MFPLYDGTFHVDVFAMTTSSSNRYNPLVSMIPIRPVVALFAVLTLAACEQADDTNPEPSSPNAASIEGFDGDTASGSNLWEGPEQVGDGALADAMPDSQGEMASSSDDDATSASAEIDSENDHSQNVAGSRDDLTYPTVPADVGAVMLYEYRSTTPSFVIGNATAHFGYQAKESEPKAVYASCHVAKATIPPQIVPALPSWDAGDIVISGTVSPIRLRYSDANIESPGYQCSLPTDHGELFYDEGTSVKITGMGGADVGAFDATIPTPPPVELLAPPLGLTKPISTELPLTIQWTANPGATSVVVSLVGLDNLYNVIPEQSVHCVITGDTGVVTVPADAMKQLPKNFGTNLGIAVTRFHKSAIAVDNLPVDLIIARATAGVAKAQ